MIQQSILNGDFGTSQTAGKMRQLVNASLVDPLVIQTARYLASQSMQRNRDDQVATIRQYLTDHFHFVNDPRGVELLVTPRMMLDTINKRGVTAGDCDEAAILAAALGKAIGLRARFVFLGFVGGGGRFSHVFTVLRGGSGWCFLDVTKPQRGPFPAVTRRTSMEV